MGSVFCVSDGLVILTDCHSTPLLTHRGLLYCNWYKDLFEVIFPVLLCRDM